MRIKMLTTKRVTCDGFHTRVLAKDAEYSVGNEPFDISDTVARSMVNQALATEIEDERLTPSESLYQALKPPTRDEMNKIFGK